MQIYDPKAFTQTCNYDISVSDRVSKMSNIGDGEVCVVFPSFFTFDECETIMDDCRRHGLIEAYEYANTNLVTAANDKSDYRYFARVTDYEAYSIFARELYTSIDWPPIAVVYTPSEQEV